VTSDQSQLERTVLRYTGVLTAILYFCGFAYLKYLFRQFNIDIWDLKFGWIDIIPYSWSVVEQLPRLIYSSPKYLLIVIILIPMSLAVAERLANRLASRQTLSSTIAGHVGLLNLRFYLPALALLLLFYILVSLTQEAALYRKDISVRGQRTAVEIRFRAEGGRKRGKTAYFFAATPDWLYLFTCRAKECIDGQVDTVHVPRNTIESILFHRE
jgi:hypothetical protein